MIMKHTAVPLRPSKTVRRSHRSKLIVICLLAYIQWSWRNVYVYIAN